MDLLIFGFLALAAVSGGLLSLFSYFGYWQNKETWAIWSFYCLVVFTITAGFLTWQKRVWDKQTQAASPRAQPLAVTIGTSLGTPLRAVNNASAWYVYQSPGVGKTISPIHRLMVIRITNLQAVRSQIETYRVEALTERGDWVRLTWIDGQIGNVYMLIGGDPKKSSQLDMPALDQVLVGRTINPRETIEGWAFFELPESIPLKQPLRMYVKDFGGAEVTQTVERHEDFAQGAGVRPRPAVDLSDYTLRYYSETPH